MKNDTFACQHPLRDIFHNDMTLVSSPCYIVAEVGVNHGGDLNTAKKLVFAAKESGADAVKFQTFTASTLVSHGTPKVEYQKKTTSNQESHYDMIRNLELSRNDHKIIKQYCDKLKIDFISTPYDIESAKFLDKELGISFFKTASADLVDLPLHEFLAGTGKSVIIATGMATLGEVEETVKIYRKHTPDSKLKIILLHCVSNYPCHIDSINLQAMQTLQNAFQVPVGFSDHSLGAIPAVVAVSLGAKIIEKHFTLDKSLPGPDHRASSTPEEFSQLVQAVREAEKALGNPVKTCQEEERQMAMVSRKSIVAARDIPEGKKLAYDDFVMKRPGTGLRAIELKKLVGLKARVTIKRDQVVNWYHIKE